MAREADAPEGRIALAVPCRTDEPALGRTLAAAVTSWRRAGGAAGGALDVLVCLNGNGPHGPLADLRAFAGREGVPVVEVDLDGAAPAVPPATAPLAVAALLTRRVGKAHAWNALRRLVGGPVAVFVDADVSFTADAVGRLLAALAGHPGAVLASARTRCAPRPGLFERIMAAPYDVEFPNLSPQLYAARIHALPAAMPGDLIEPERWLELTIGTGGGRIVRAPGVEVAVRLPATLADFFRQRIRIEMGKVQLRRDYPGLAARGAPQPRVRAALGLPPPALGRLAAYLALRSVAHGLAWARYRRGRTADVWRQAASTKRW